MHSKRPRDEEVIVYLQVWQHAKKTPKQTPVHGLSIPLQFNLLQNAFHCSLLNSTVAHDVGAKQLQTGVPAANT